MNQNPSWEANSRPPIDKKFLTLNYLVIKVYLTTLLAGQAIVYSIKGTMAIQAVDGSDCGIFQSIIPEFAGRSEGTSPPKPLSQDNLCCARDWNVSLHEYSSERLPPEVTCLVSQPLMQSKRLLPYLQEAAIGPCSEPHESNPYPHSLVKVKKVKLSL
jgi:hypothetical protein